MKTIYDLNTGKKITPLIATFIKGASVFLLLALPVLAFASVEGSLHAVQSKIVGTLLPLLAICGLLFAGMSFVLGHANARQHLVFAIFGAAVGFGAESIVNLIRTLIH